MNIEVACAKCGKAFLVDASAAGSLFPCPECAATITVPAGGTAPAAPNDEEVVCPRCQLHFSLQRHRAAAPLARKRHRVLIVEDMGYFRKIAENALADEYDVATATCVEEAKTALAGGGIDLIVLDLTLGDRNDGLGLLRDSIYKPCPVLIFTARDESEMYGEEWETLRQLGADDIVIKGMNVAESLQRKVGLLLGKTWRDEESRPD